MEFDVTITGAVLAGFISFVSPCVLPLVPPYLCYMAGVSMDQFTGTNDKQRAASRVFFSAFAFVLGFSTVFVLLGAGASVIGQYLKLYSGILSYVAGAIIIIMGLHFLGVFRIAFLYREARVNVDRKPAGLIGAYLIGLAFAFGWTPCIGPVLATILAVAGTEENVQQGMILLSAYSLGLGIPFLLAAAFASQFMGLMQRFRKHIGTVEKVMGALLVITGVLFVTGQVQNAAFWLQEMLPALNSLG
ncbi:cytochrome c biogenesis CcdA family protein [Cohaesibacter celericrescens]|jgi:cytochrome c-type biogenesis protein|uniref:Cytochrome C biogenesis protein n=1 Tax=Cohaesibacter celericrescens TaxID=2067669 RepID=A0A2N5XT08_9HYPH|nr:cytochrome c biogenesis protein CcdA [Cohaesibacter celericrescens]PLW77643.1 cytochrome C biogenesis protein [Cohaesibacter celericrescens]